MDIVKYLGRIEIDAQSEKEIKEFVKDRYSIIQDCLTKLWVDYSNNPITKSLIVQKEYTDEPIIIQLVEDNMLGPEFDSKNIVQAELTLDNDTETIKPEKHTIINETFRLQVINKRIILPNGKVNQEYSFIFKIDELGLPDIGDFWFDGLNEIGLSFDSITNEIKGKPTIAGDHKINIKIKRSDWVEGKPIFVRPIILIINPDPKSLWKNIPTPDDIEYYKSDSDKCFIKVESTSFLLGKGGQKKDMVAASQRGRSHAQEGKPRDDDFALHYVKEHDWYIMTVADGAGSAKESRKGSEIACKTVVDVCMTMINQSFKEFEHQIKEFNNSDKSDIQRKKLGDIFYKIMGNAVFKSLKNIEEEARISNKPLKDYATTLIVSISKKFKFGWFVGAFWVGDGGIGIYNKENQFLKVLGESDGGEYAGQTRFLTMSEITQPAEFYRRLRFDIVDDFTALILMTDGITDPKFETDANLLKFEKWNELWQDLSKEVDFSDNNEACADQLLKWLDFWSPGNHDDRTIAILF
jgi:serine/threonine protein phosphatase PrpC